MSVAVEVWGEVLFRQEVYLDHWWTAGNERVLELEHYTYHDWELVSIRDSISHFCFVNSIETDACNGLVTAVHSDILENYPHLIDIFDGNDDTTCQVHNSSGGNFIETSIRFDDSPRTTFNMVNMIPVAEDIMDTVFEFFPEEYHVNVLKPEDVELSQSIKETTTPIDMILVNVASNTSLIREYIEKYNILIMIHTADEWYGKKYSHELLTHVR